nr:hypothetical protein [Tanacetum cinerariifolium]
QVQKLQVGEAAGGIEQHVDNAQKNRDVLDFGARVHVQAAHVQAGAFHHPLEVSQLVNADAKLAVDVPRRDFVVAARLDVRVQAHAHRVRAAKRGPEALEQRQVIDVEVDAQLLGLHQLAERHAVGGKENVLGLKPDVQTQLYFVDAHAVEARAFGQQQLQHGHVGEGLAGVEKPRGVAAKRGRELVVLRPNSIGLVHVERGAKLGGGGQQGRSRKRSGHYETTKSSGKAT